MTQVSMTINDVHLSDDVEPRMTLADFVRERQGLTGTHLACEQGACGACTVLLNGEPARACVVFAVSCEGADIRTIEGFDDDALMASLRQAFHEEHGLQCGFCTPGMLVSAYDVARRHSEPDTKAIRSEMSGNLCRCTGYVGIVRAIARVIEERAGKGA